MGLIPDCDLANVSSAGNAAVTGDRIALLNATSRTNIETAVEEKFQQYFVEAIAFPNKMDGFPNLFEVVAWPIPLIGIVGSVDSSKCRQRGRRI